MMTNRKRANSLDVAALAGVSQATVSRAFTPGASISAKTKQKIEAAATKLDYQPNIIARSLSKRQSKLIGLLFTNWAHPKAADLLKKITEALTDYGYKIIVQSATSNHQTDDALRDFLQYQVDGVMVFSATPSSEVTTEYARARTPIVLLNRTGLALNTSSVSIDATAIGRHIATSLLDQSYRRFALISADPESQIVIKISKAVASITAEHPDAEIICQRSGVDGYEAGFREISRIWGNQEARPDAIICSADNTALGILAGCKQHLNINVPDDLAVIGLGDIPPSGWKDHNLTTVKIPHDEMVSKAVESLIAGIEDPSLEPLAFEFQAQLILRGTTRPVPVSTESLL